MLVLSGYNVEPIKKWNAITVELSQQSTVELRVVWFGEVCFGLTKQKCK